MKKSFSLAEISQTVQGHLIGHADFRVCSLSGLDKATPRDISFIADPKYLKKNIELKAGAYILKKDFPMESLEDKNLILVENVRLALNQLADLFYPKTKFKTGISSEATIADSATIGDGVSIYPNVFIGENATLADNCVIMPGCFIGNETAIGKATIIYPNNVFYERTKVGQNCVIGANNVFGKEGFGYYQDENGNHNRIRHVGRVVIEDEVEIGSGCTFDRGTYGDTLIGRGTKIDNLVHIAHNVTIGERNILAAQVGFAGSTSSGNDCVFLGKSGVSQGVKVHAGTILRSNSIMYGNNPAGGIWSGDKAIPLKEYNKRNVNLAAISGLRQEIKSLKEQMEDLKTRLKPSENSPKN